MNMLTNELLYGFKIFQDNILTQPVFFIGLIVLIGNLFLKKQFHETFSSTVKAIVGAMLWQVAAGGLVNNFRPILAGLNERFKLNAAIIDPYFGLNAATAAFKSIGTAASWTMISLLIGFGWNIVLLLFRKQTKIRTLFLTGHVMIQQATTATWIIFLAIPTFRNITGSMLVGLLIGTYWAVFSNLTVEATEDLTENAGFAVGHQQMFAVWLTDKIAPKIGNKEKSVENINLPGWLSMFNDNVIATSALMLIFFGTILIILGPNYLRKIDAATFPATLGFPMYIILKSLYFSVYLSILMSGIRMFISELTESFRGISEKLLPGSMPAIDCAGTYGFSSPNVITYGFLCGCIGQFIAIAGLLVFHSPILIITGFVPVFFDNATLAVFANKKGGVRATTIITFCCGILQVLGGAFAASYFGLYKFGGWHGNIDWDTLWPTIGVLINTLKIPGVILVVILMLIIPQLQYRRHKEGYFDHNI